MPSASPLRYPILLLLASVIAVGACAPAADSELHVAAASSLAPAFEELAEAFRQAHGAPVLLTYGASVDLSQQLLNGAPYDVFASADPALTEELAAAGIADRGSLRVFARGELALVVLPAWADALDSGIALLDDPEIRVIAIADPAHAPFGRAARQALQSAGMWEELEDAVVFGGSARHALELITTGNAQAGLAPLSLAVGSGLPWARIPSDLYEAPSYSIAVRLSSRRGDAGRRFLELLGSELGAEILRSHGLTPEAER